MSMFKRVCLLFLCLVLLIGLCPREALAASPFAGVKGPTLVKQDGIWYYVKDGAVCYDTTLVKYSGSWWYVTGGKVASSTTTLVKFNGSWWYVKNGKVASSTTSLVKFNNEWWYVKSGKVASSTTTLVKFNNEWWYIVKGKVAANTTTLVNFNNQWWYVVKGKIAGNTTTLVKHAGSWWYIVKGKLAGATTTLVKFNGSWYYVENGKVASGKTTLFTFNGRQYYIKNGVAQTGYTGYVTYQGKQIYLKNGAVSTPPVANPVVHALNKTIKVNPRPQYADFIIPNLTVDIRIPKINSTAPGAAALNRKLYNEFYEYYEYMIDNPVQEWAFDVSYEYREFNGIVGITVTISSIELPGHVFEDFCSFYYNMNTDRELTQAEYYQALGTNKTALTRLLKQTPAFRGAYSYEDTTSDLYSCIVGRNGAFAIFKDPETLNGYRTLATEPVL